MTVYPAMSELRLWVPLAVDIFKTYMPAIDKPYPQVHIATARTYPKMRADLLGQTGCKHLEEPEASVMEYIHGDKGYAILIRQNLLPDKNDEHFCWMLWHELGHFYAINSELNDLHHYNDPGLADGSQTVEFTSDGPVLGMSDERLKQEGYWFWQEFIAEAISKYVSYKHRSTTRDYHPERLDWHPKYWGGIVDKLMMLLEDTFFHYPNTIDEYALAHYFANLLMDDFIVLYVKAAEEGKLKVYDNGVAPPAIVYPDEPIEPTRISDVDEESFQKPLWKMKALLETQVRKEGFWIIDEGFLLEIGRCIGEMMFAKIMYRAQHMFD